MVTVSQSEVYQALKNKCKYLMFSGEAGDSPKKLAGILFYHQLHIYIIKVPAEYFNRVRGVRLGDANFAFVCHC